MALNSEVSSHQLPCGRSVEDVWNELRAHAVSRHAAGCAHCQTARRSLEPLASATSLLMQEELEPPEGLLDRIMQAVRAEVRRTDSVPLPSAHGPAAISNDAFAVVLRYAADTVDGVRARTVSVTVDPDYSGRVRVRMSLSLRYGVGPIGELFDTVRDRIDAAVSGQIGVFTSAIDLGVDDVWEAPAAFWEITEQVGQTTELPAAFPQGGRR
ncbi:MAG: Asp23/Gls24 family envelope stress response protein [Sciscionella sp.]